jgi:hypothetical protein
MRSWGLAIPEPGITNKFHNIISKNSSLESATSAQQVATSAREGQNKSI